MKQFLLRRKQKPQHSQHSGTTIFNLSQKRGKKTQIGTHIDTEIFQSEKHQTQLLLIGKQPVITDFFATENIENYPTGDEEVPVCIELTVSCMHASCI